MEKRSRIDADEFSVPEVLIQHIQSFMSGKEAAQTSILTKSWYAAWSTRPILDFNQRDFDSGVPIHRREERFWEFVKKTIQRYEALNLKIESFRLWIRELRPYDYWLVKEFIVKAMKMGAADFSLEICSCNQTFSLPREVFDSETLRRLSVRGCKIDDRADRKVICRKLESLSLNDVLLDDDILICDLISSCPLIEKLTLGTFTVQLPVNVKTYGLGSSILYKLKSLFLDHVVVDSLLFSNLSSNFPCLKDLSLHQCGGDYRGIQISSRSLECITFFLNDGLLRAKFDVPSIRKFRFAGSSWPSLFFKTVSREWESDISIVIHSCSTTLFLKLKKLLTCLSLSKITIDVGFWTIVEKSVDFRGLPETAVENIAIHAPPSTWFMVLEYLFRSFRPKFISLDLLTGGLRSRVKVNKDFLEILRERNVERIREICLMMNHELEEVDVELFELPCCKETTFASSNSLPVEMGRLQRQSLKQSWFDSFP